SAGGENGSQVETEIPVETNNSTGIGDVSSADQSTKEYWQEQVRNIYAEIDRTEADIKKNQWELNNLNNQLQAEDIYEKRMQMLKKMDALRKSIPELEQKLIDLNQEMEDLEDRARKQGILPGWLRVERPEPMQDQEPKKNQNNSTEKG
ncbi:MAG: hypothetical protein MUF15_09420, partial [Acidobacteria bacterium]|nr:hypothetical protein [Acidobacteriota bacterium]